LQPLRAAVGACETPVSIYVTSFGGWNNVCGTSVGSPLVAGIEAHAGEYARSLPGAAAFYLDGGALFDVTSGRNGECTPPVQDEYRCHTGPGYDGPTGNGTPDGPLGLAAGPPAATTRPASAVASGAATLNGTLDPNNFEATYRFEYGTTASYGANVPVSPVSAGAGKLSVQVSQAIGGLKPGTTYHYRLVASNGQGTTDGADNAFATGAPIVEGVNASSGSIVGGTAVTVSGTNLTGATAVDFGSAEAESFTVQSSTTISAVAPRALVPGAVDVTVTTGAGRSATGPADEYLYTAGPKLVPTDESGKGFFGQSVALSSNGNTALIGGPGDNLASGFSEYPRHSYGAAWVFTRSGTAWIQQGPKLTPNDESGEADFGWSVALSANGKTALIGGPADDENRGAAWIFSRSGSAWTQRGTKLTGGGEIATGSFGASVALSADANTALIGGYSDNLGRGAAWSFTRSGSAWTQEGAKLTPGDESGSGLFGWSVALSSDGKTALIGSPFDGTLAPEGPVYEYGIGAAWVFARHGPTWSQQGAKLTPDDASRPSKEELERNGSVGTESFGASAALSSDSNTALIGGPGDNGGHGAAWDFTRHGSKWSQQGAKLIHNGDSPLFGRSAALSAEGNTAVIGSQAHDRDGAAWAYTRSGAAWAQQGGRLAPTDESIGGAFGYSVALSANGNTTLIGGQVDRGNENGQTQAVWPWGGYGAAWVFTRSGSSWTE
jgi:hypothetical protein